MNQKNICYFSWEISFFHLLTHHFYCFTCLFRHSRNPTERNEEEKNILLISQQKIFSLSNSIVIVLVNSILSPKKIKPGEELEKNEQITVGNFPNKQSDFIFSLNVLSRYAVFLCTIHTAFLSWVWSIINL